MEFKTRRINNKPEKPPKKKVNLSILLSIAIIATLVIGTVKALGTINMGVFLKAAGSNLLTDAYGHTNILLMGTGGGTHDGADLTDTIIVASIDQEKHTVSMLSIPRDLYVEDKTLGSSRINEIYFNAKNHFDSDIRGINYFKDKMELITGIPVHYWIKIDFQGFTDLVNALGGIDVTIKESIYDATYPKDGTYEYQPFSIAAGPQHLDGETALKVARSRHSTSDFDRAERQQNIIYAIKEKALSLGTIFNTGKIQAILDSLKNNIYTNITIDEILTLGSFAEDFSKENIKQHLIHDDPNKCGGFLYTPMREAYGGAFVLLPAGGFKTIQTYSDLNFNLQDIQAENTKIHILNGTKRGGVAGETKQVLQRFCFDIVHFGNATDQHIPTTTYYYKQKYDEKNNPIDSRPAALDFLERLIPGKESTTIPVEYKEKGLLEEATIILEIGEDYANSPNYIEDNFYSLPNTSVAPVPTTTTPTEAPAVPNASQTTPTTDAPQ